MRVCKSSDDTKGVHSFLKAKNEIPSTHPCKQEILDKIDLFNKAIKKLQKERRHTQLAHLKIGIEDNDYEIRYDLTPAIKLIVEIVDLMSKTAISYSWSDGRCEKFDLRKQVF